METADIEVLGSKIHVQRGGDGEPLLFLHGAQGFAGWEPGLAALATDFDVIAPDHPGFGRSVANDRVDTIEDLANFTLDLLDTINIEKFHLIGQCIGGWLAMEIALRARDRLKSLTLVNSAGIRVKGSPRADIFICTQDELLKLLFAGSCGQAWLGQWTDQPDAFERNAAAAAKFAWQPRLCSLTLDHWLHRITTPTHIIWGDTNHIIPSAYADELAKLIPNAKSTTLANCGHLAHFEQPTALATATKTFIRELAR